MTTLTCVLATVWLWSVWPDIGIKSSPKFSRCCQKVALAVFTVFQNSANCCHQFGLLLKKTLSPRTFKNCTIWSHWLWWGLVTRQELLVERYFISLWAVNINERYLHDLQTGLHSIDFSADRRLARNTNYCITEVKEWSHLRGYYHLLFTSIQYLG